MGDWDEPQIVIVLPLGLRPGGMYPYGTISVSLPFIPVAWQATTEFLADANAPVGVVVQRPNRPALRARTGLVR